MPAAQPIKTAGGYPMRNGSPSNIYTTGNFSITIRSKTGGVVFSSPNAASLFDASVITFTQAGTGAATRSMQDKMREVVSVKDFGAVGDGVAGDSAAFSKANAATPSGAPIFVPAGTYNLDYSFTCTGRNWILEGATLTGVGSLTGGILISRTGAGAAGSKRYAFSDETGLRNMVVNGGMRIDQWNNGNAVTTTNVYIVDRFRWLVSPSASLSAVRGAVNGNYDAGYNSLAVNVVSGGAALASDQFRIMHAIPARNTDHLQFGTSNAKTTTLSFYVYGSITGTYSVAFYNQAANRSYVSTYVINSANTWEKKTVILPGDTAGTWERGTDNAGIVLVWDLGSGSTSQTGTINTWNAALYLKATGSVSIANTTGATLYLANVQFEVGSASTTMEPRPYELELELCGTPNANKVCGFEPGVASAASFNGGQVGGSRNPIVNGQFLVWQLGTSFTLGTHLQKNADRWNYDFNGTAGTATISRATVPTSAWTADFYPSYCLRFNQSVAGAGNTFQDISTQIEGVGVLAGKPVTISFWAISNSGGTPSFTAIKTEQYFGSGGSPSSPAFTTSAPVAIDGTWRRYTVFAQLASVNGKTLGTNADDTLNVIFTMPLNQVCDISITNVQIEAGVVATPFEYRSRAAVTADCQRYLVSSYDDGVAPGTVTSNGALAFTQGAANNVKDIQLPAKMRTTPVVVLYNPATGATGTWNNGGAAVAASLNTGGMKNISISTTGGSAGGFMTGHFVAQDPLI
jgi:hypothetical protein